MKKPFYIFLFSVMLFAGSCEKEKGDPEFGQFPNDIGKIIFTDCAVSGCHTDKSKDAAGGLSLESWDKMFQGGTGNAVVIPFQPKYSTLFSFVNTHSDLGPTNIPTMPVGKPPLSREQVILIKDWIAAGAPDRTGFIKFSDNALRRKYYVANQGCDVVTVVDAATNLAMRYIDVGADPNIIESAHMVKVSPDGQFWYVIFSQTASVIQKFRTSDDSFVGEINITAGSWNTFTITPDSKQAFVIDFSNNGRVAHVDLENLSLIGIWQGANLFTQPHGSAVGPYSDSVYVTAQSGNFIYKISPSDPSSPRQISLVPGQVPSSVSSVNPHELAFTPDGTKYFVTCQGTNEVRVMQSNNDSLLAVIPVGVFPSELSFSATSDYLFVTCMEDPAGTGFKGSVGVINYRTNNLVKTLNTGFFQPHGIAVDDKAKLVYVINRNFSSGGPAPHHSTLCGTKNGYINFIDLNSLEVISGKKIEVVSDPYSVALRK